MKIVFKNIFLYTFFVFIAIQFIQVDIPVSTTNKNLEIKAPPELMNIFKTSCYDCHSNEVNLPWYSNVAPMSWTISRHIDLGRKWLNFSIWETYSNEEKDKKLEEIYKAIYQAMPLRSYEFLHEDAKLTQKQRALVRKWTNKAPF
jgi:hypothetical protein